MTYEETFLKDFEEWLNTQVMVNEVAMAEAKKIVEEDKDESGVPGVEDNTYVESYTYSDILTEKTLIHYFD